MTTKKEFLAEKLNNMVNWIEGSKLLPKNHDLIKKLKTFRTNQDDFLQFVVNMAQYADQDCHIKDEYLKMFLVQQGVKYEKLDVEDVSKLGKYIQCFIKTVRN